MPLELILVPVCWRVLVFSFHGEGKGKGKRVSERRRKEKREEKEARKNGRGRRKNPILTGGDHAVRLPLPEGDLALGLDDDVHGLSRGLGPDDALDGLDLGLFSGRRRRRSEKEKKGRSRRSAARLEREGQVKRGKKIAELAPEALERTNEKKKKEKTFSIYLERRLVVEGVEGHLSLLELERDLLADDLRWTRGKRGRG